MQSIFIVGIILFLGFIFGEIAKAVKLPKVTGYILSGILLNPHICRFVPMDFPQHTELITQISLAFITFSIGGTLLYSRVKQLGKIVLSITFFEAQFAFLAVALAFIVLGPVLMPLMRGTWVVFVPLGILMGALASPTDPSATIAVVHEYKAQGEVTSTIMGVAAFDDILGIVNYCVGVAVAGSLIAHTSASIDSVVWKPALIIAGSIGLGVVFGLIFNAISRAIKRETEGVFIVLIFGLISLCYGTATLFGLDELLATVSMGILVVNFNRMHEKIFGMLERYTEELIFILFFTVSGMHLDLVVLMSNWLLVVVFAIARAAGKYSGVYVGGHVSGAGKNIKKFIAPGLIPQGGIVIGLALLIQQNPLFDQFSSILINTVLGATVFHELLGPVLSRWAILKAGEAHQLSA